jgi:mRNA-degrading endonuclease toxin of MazEF toxin-antitoxin module
MERGDIYHVDLNPIEGREQAGSRYVMIVTTREFNKLGTPVVCPITQGGKFARDRGFAVSLTGAGLNVQGVVLCNQLRVLDLRARHARFSEKAPQDIIDEVLARISPLFE